MNNNRFIEKCKKIIKDYNDEHNSDTVSMDEILVVWSSKTLQNNKALLVTTTLNGMYYELTYNGDRKELYLDVYKKVAAKQFDL